MFNTKIYFKSLALLLGQTSYAQFSTLPPHYCSVHNKVLCPHHHYYCMHSSVLYLLIIVLCTIKYCALIIYVQELKLGYLKLASIPS